MLLKILELIQAHFALAAVLRRNPLCSKLGFHFSLMTCKRGYRGFIDTIYVKFILSSKEKQFIGIYTETGNTISFHTHYNARPLRKKKNK